jgi:hypothetical protein
MAKRFIQELSAQTKYDAAIKAASKGFDSSNDNDMERKKAMQQGDALLKHVDPETVKKVEAFAKQLDLDYTIKKDPSGSKYESTIAIVLGKNLKSPNLAQSAPIKVYITKDKSKVDGVLPDQATERKLGALIKYIQQKELAVNLKDVGQVQEAKRKLTSLIDKLIKEELSAHNKIKEALGPAKKISDAEAVTILNNKKYDIETTIDYDYAYRDRATDILAELEGKLKADSFDNIEGENTIRLSVYTPGKEAPFFLIRDVKNRSWSMKEFEENEVNERQEELGEGERYAGRDAEVDARKDQDFNRLSPETQKNVLDKLRKGGSVTLENEDQPAPSAADIAGKMSEILDKLNNMSEMKQDPKYKKHAEKAAKYMEAAKSALEGLTNYETMLEEKDKENKEKGAGKVLKTIEKALSKIIKDKNTVAKIMHKMPVSKVIELQSTANKELDEEKVAKAMLNVALKEGYINSNK